MLYFIVTSKGFDFDANRCINMNQLACGTNPDYWPLFGANSTKVACPSADGSNPDKVEAEFFPESAYGKAYAILTSYDNSVGAKRCQTVLDKGDKDGQGWERQAVLADGTCRFAGRQRYQQLSCQSDGSVYIRDWCDPQCTECKYKSLIGYNGNSCGELGDVGGQLDIVGGYCTLAAKGSIPAERPSKGWKPPPVTGPDQVVTAAAGKLAILTSSILIPFLAGFVGFSLT
ncbi:hypothetical protein DFS34DRAFT_377044 [Phlyctochytrium arcticum]|nr:hypothetical protein DFS34DRAFT_377044 [Phlyctochytrium arcticum]